MPRRARGGRIVLISDAVTQLERYRAHDPTVFGRDIDAGDAVPAGDICDAGSER